MTEPRWVSTSQAVRIHSEQLAIFGGPPGIRDFGMLESALGRPKNKWSYGETDLAALAAAYAFGISRNHPFVDGNKRASFMVMIVFLRKNGVEFAPTEALATEATLSLAAGEIDEDGLTRWIRDNWPKQRKKR
jgi:death-on-curing protein